MIMMPVLSLKVLTFSYLYHLLLWARLTSATTLPITEDVYTKLVRYTRFSAAAYADNCATPPEGASVVSYISNTTTNTQATFFKDDANGDLIMAFRGTSTIQNFLSDFDQTLVAFDSEGVDCDNCTVLEGYFKQWTSISATVISAITSAVSSNPTYNVTITGHSMGASLAALASPSILAALDSPEKLTTYTYGQPRTGNRDFADYMDNLLAFQGRLFRVTHSNDGVPQIPSEDDGYRHHQVEYWGNDPPSAANTVQCEGQEPPDCNLSEPGYGIGNDGIGINAAHLSYFGISIGDPVDPGLSSCSG